MIVTPALWRSPLQRETDRLGARSVPAGDAAVAVAIGDEVAAVARAQSLGYADLSPLPRIGVKGAGATAFLGADGWRLPEAPNLAAMQHDGATVARLGAEDYLVYGAGGRVDGIAARWQASVLARRGWLVPRRDGLAWIALTGGHAPTLLSKLCAVDLRPAHFAPGAVAQTIVAKLSAVIVRGGAGANPRYDLFADSASAVYLWDCLADAATEFGGGAIGCRALGIEPG